MSNRIILSFPRSATNYTTEVLCKAGIPARHEREPMDRFVTVTGLFTFIKYDMNAYSVILHQTRNTLDVISSAAWHLSDKGLSNIEKTFKCGVDDVIKDMAGSVRGGGKWLYRVMNAWLTFVKTADQQCCLRYRVEDIECRWDEILCALGEIKRSFPEGISKTFARKRRTGYTKLSWDCLYDCNKQLAEKVRQKSIELGYIQESVK